MAEIQLQPEQASHSQVIPYHVQEHVQLAAGHGQGHHGGILNPPPMQGNPGPQDPHHGNIVYNDMQYRRAASGDPAFPHMHYNFGFAQGEVVVPQEPHGPDHFDPADPQVVLGPAQAAFPQAGPLVHDAPPPSHPEAAAENLRYFVIRLLNHPDSQVDMVRMEPGAAGRYRVMISLSMADFL